MQKQAPSLGRILVMAGFALSCFGLLLFLWLAFGGPIPLQPKGYRFNVAFKEAGTLSPEADVRISGVSVGKVKVINADKETGASDATIQLDTAYAPIPKDTKAILRQKTLLGETYVELTPGLQERRDDPRERPPARRRGVADRRARRDLPRLRPEDARRRSSIWMQQLALASQGRGRDISDALGNLAPFAEDTTTLLKILNAQHTDVQGVVRDTGEVFDALSERDGQLRSLIENSNRVFATTAARNRELEETFRALPTFERESTAHPGAPDEFAKDTNPLVTQLRPAARQLSPTLQDLSKLAPDLKALFHNLNPLFDVAKAGPARDRGLPRRAAPAAGQLRRAAAPAQPAAARPGQYKNELSAFFANTPRPPRPRRRRATRACTTCVRPTRSIPRTSPSIRAGSPPTAPTRTTFPDAFKNLAAGLLSYETRQCASGPVPTLVTQPQPGLPIDPLSLIPADLAANVQKFFFGPTATNGAVAAPACKQQGKFPFGGEVTQYPHVNAATGPTARALARSRRPARAARRARASHGVRQRPGAPGAARRGRRRDRRPRAWRWPPGRGLRGARRLQRRAPGGGALPPGPDGLRARAADPQRVRRAPRPAQPLRSRRRRRAYPSQGVKGFIDAAVTAVGARRRARSPSCRTRCARSRSATPSCAPACRRCAA